MEPQAPIGLVTIRLERHMGAVRLRVSTCRDTLEAADADLERRVHTDPAEAIEAVRAFVEAWVDDGP